MMAMFESLQYWHWLVLAVLLLIAETLLPGSFMLWFGVGAAAVGLLLLVVPGLAWEVQLVVFALVAVAAVVGWRQYKARHPETTSHPTLNQRGQSYIGRRLTLIEPIVNGYGKLKMDDSIWKVSGPDLPAGTTVKVIGVDGTMLLVRRLHAQPKRFT